MSLRISLSKYLLVVYAQPNTTNPKIERKKVLYEQQRVFPPPTNTCFLRLGKGDSSMNNDKEEFNTS
jgi:hypothetical protein|tara:strand:- start:352 stop:552 length:201 start_codon:yes stop_codon:yes gene_type:complete